MKSCAKCQAFQHNPKNLTFSSPCPGRGENDTAFLVSDKDVMVVDGAAVVGTGCVFAEEPVPLWAVQLLLFFAGEVADPSAIEGSAEIERAGIPGLILLVAVLLLLLMLVVDAVPEASPPPFFCFVITSLLLLLLPLLLLPTPLSPCRSGLRNVLNSATAAAVAAAACSSSSLL